MSTPWAYGLDQVTEHPHKTVSVGMWILMTPIMYHINEGKVEVCLICKQRCHNVSVWTGHGIALLRIFLFNCFRSSNCKEARFEDMYSP